MEIPLSKGYDNLLKIDGEPVTGLPGDSRTVIYGSLWKLALIQIIQKSQ